MAVKFVPFQTLNGSGTGLQSESSEFGIINLCFLSDLFPFSLPFFSSIFLKNMLILIMILKKNLK